MSEPTGRPTEPETTPLPGTPSGAETAPQWAVASTGHAQTQPFEVGGPPAEAGSPARVPAGATVGGPATERLVAQPGAPIGTGSTTPGSTTPGSTTPGGPWRAGTAAGGYPGGTLPPQPDGWGPQTDVIAHGPDGAAPRKFPLALAAAGGAVLIAGAAFAAGMAIGGHDGQAQNTAVGIPFGNGQPGNGQPGQGQGGNGQGGNGQGGNGGQGLGGQLGQGQGQQGQGQQGQGQQGQGQQGQGQQGQGQQGQGGAPNGGQLPSGIGRLVAAGTIASIDAGGGGTIVVQGQNGQVTVRTSAATQVEQDLGGSVDALQVGDLIFVAGSIGNDGTVTALAIADRPFFAGIPGNRNGSQNGGGQTGQNGSGGQNTVDQNPGQDDGGVTT